MCLKIGVAFKQKMWGEESVDSHLILKKSIRIPKFHSPQVHTRERLQKQLCSWTAVSTS